MCGFVGYISDVPKEINSNWKETFRYMNDLITHRGPDDHGYFLMNTSVLGFGG